MLENNGVIATSTKPWWQSYKFTTSMIVVILLFVTLVVLALTGAISIESEQIFSLGRWLIVTLTGGHVVQRVGESVGGGLAARGAPPAIFPIPAPAPPPPSSTSGEPK